MYAAPVYGYGPNPNGTPSQQQQPHNPHQPGQQQQPQPHMMFNPQQQQQQQQQQYAAAAAASVGSHQSPYGAQGGPGTMGMMQNNGLAHAGPHVSPYQTPYSSSPYVGNMPTSTALPPNFMPTTSGAPSFPMNASNMNPQHQGQRMQPPPTSSTPTHSGPRASPFAGAPHNSPPHSAPPAQQFSTPQAQAQSQVQSQTPNNNQQGQSGTILTPQTPNFPPGAQGTNAGSNIATPLSPGSETRERDRVTVLLEINKYLLLEVMRLQAVQAEGKKEDSAPGNSPDGAEKERADKESEKAEKAKPASRDYFECMRRLQSNLAYLAAIADRSHKPSSQIPPHPAIMSAPPLSPRSTQPPSTTSGSPKTDAKRDEPEESKVEGLNDDHGESLKEQYKKLQALFPGVDPKKEPPVQPAAVAAARQQAQQQQAAQMMAKQQGGQQQSQGHGGGPGQPVDPNAQQKLQNDLLRQKMMQAQHAQQAAQQQQMQGGMLGMNPQQQGGPVQGR